MKIKKKIILKEKIKKLKINKILEYIIIITKLGKIGIFDIEGNFILNFSNSLKIKNIKKIINFDFNNKYLILLEKNHNIFFFNMNNFKFEKKINFLENKKLEKFENIFIHKKFDFIFLKNQNGFLKIFNLENFSFINKLDLLKSKIISLYKKKNNFCYFTENLNMINLNLKNNKFFSEIEKFEKIEKNLKFVIYDEKSKIILLVTKIDEIFKINSENFKIIEKLEKKFFCIYKIKYLEKKKLLILRDKKKIYILSIHPFFSILYKINSNLFSLNKFLYKFFIFEKNEKNFKILFFENPKKIKLLNLSKNSKNEIESNLINFYDIKNFILNFEILKKKKMIIFLTNKPSLKICKITTGTFQKEIFLDFLPKKIFLGFNEIFIYLEKKNYDNKKKYIIIINLYNGKKYGGISFFDKLSFLKIFEDNLIFCGKNGLLTILDYPKKFEEIKNIFEKKNFLEKKKNNFKKKNEEKKIYDDFLFKRNSEKKIGFLKESFYFDNLKLHKIEKNLDFKNDLNELENIFNDFSNKENFSIKKIKEKNFEKIEKFGNFEKSELNLQKSYPILPDPDDIDDFK